MTHRIILAIEIALALYLTAFAVWFGSSADVVSIGVLVLREWWG